MSKLGKSQLYFGVNKVRCCPQLAIIRGKMRDADMECKVAFPSFHSILFAKFFISLVTGHEPI